MRLLPCSNRRNLGQMSTSASKRLEFYQRLNSTDWKLFPTCHRKEHPSSCGCPKPCIRINALKNWMRKKEPGSDKSNGVLLFEEIGPIKRHPYRSPTTVLGSCTIVFSWLLGAGHGQLIHVFYDAGVDDVKLRNPFYSLSKNVALKNGVTGLTNHAEYHPDKFDNLIRTLERLRWEFCPFTLVPDMDNEAFGNKLYMPFCRLWDVPESGGTADVYLAHIQEEFVSDESEFKQHLGPWVMDIEYGKCYKLAVKCITGYHLDTYMQERQAFVGIRDRPGMLKCLGFYSFTKNEHNVDEYHYNFLLEYAEKDLHQFFKQDPPRLAEHIHSQWEDFCHIAAAIETLHDFEDDGIQWSGWHGDIKPRNLLLVGGEWKLADYGFAVFHPKSDGRVKASLNERTETFGAPETVNIDEDVLQTVDTWSFGCVLSIAATWMVKGNEGVLQYQEYRSQIAKKVRHESHPPDAFHDGVDVLPHIKVWHTHLRQLMRRSDHVTNKILSLVDDRLLKTERLTSKQLRLELDEIVNQTRDLSTSAPPSASSLDKELLNFLETHSRKPHKSPTPRENGFPASRGPPPANASPCNVNPARQPVIQHPENPTVNGQLQLQTLNSPNEETPGEISPRVPNITETILPGLAVGVPVVSPVDLSFDHLQPTRSTETDGNTTTASALSGPTIGNPTDRRRNHSLASSHDQQSLNRRPSDNEGRPSDADRRTSIPTLSPLVPMTSSKGAATIDHVWAAVEELHGGAFALSGHLSCGETWIARITNERRETPLMLAASCGHLKAVRVLVKYSDLSSRDTENKSLLHHLIIGSHGNGETTEFLKTLEQILAHWPHHGNSWINWPDNDGHTCLYFCIQFDMPKAAERLLAQCPGAVNGDSADSAPLVEAMKRGRESVAKVLLSKGASLEHRERLKEYKNKTPGAWRIIERKLRESQPQTPSRRVFGVFNMRGEAR